VIDLATWQCIRDRRNNKLLNELHEEIVEYGIVKRQWGYGHVEVRVIPNDVNRHYVNKNIYFHSSYHRHYVNKCNEEKIIHLGRDFLDAMNNIADIKAFLLNTTLLGDLAVKTDQ